MNAAISRLADRFERGPLALWQRAVLFSMAYFVCAEASKFLSVRNTPYVSFWLPAGLYVAVLLLNETRAWPWLILAAFPANLVFDLFYGTKFVHILGFFCANTVQAVIGAWLVRRFVSERPALTMLREFLGLLGFAAVCSTMIGAAISAAMLTMSGLSSSFLQSWKIIWADCAMAILLLSPFILTWCSKSGANPQPFPRRKKILEAALLLFVLILLTWHLLFLEQGVMSPNKSLMLLPLLWAGLRFGPRGAATVNLLLALLIAFFTAQYFEGLTPAEIASGNYVFVMQTSLAMAALVGLIPAIVLRERDQTTARLRESEERFRNLTAAAFEGICISEDGRVLDMNDQGLKMFGYEREEMIGKEIVELVAPESRPDVAAAILTGREVIYEHRLLRKDGSSFHAEAQAKVLRAGRRLVRMTALRDITDRKKAGQALRESEEKYSKVFRNSPDAVTITRMEDGRIIEINEGFRRIFGYRPEQAIGHTSLELRLWGNPADRERALQEIRQHGFVRDWELPFRTHEGRIGIGLFSAEKIEINGDPCLVTVVRDITDRKRAEAERQQAREEYTRQLIASQEAERKRIAAELHDSLGQNLLLIKNRAQLALTGETPPAGLREQLEGISQLASQSIAEARQISHDLHPHQLAHLGLTRALAAMIDGAAESSGMVFQRKLDNVDANFPKDAAMNLYRVVQESLNNVLKHSRARSVRVRLELDVHEVQLFIEDDGQGFQPGEPGPGGKGLGLKNIAERVRMLGGKLMIHSQPGQGTRIEVSIPVAGTER